MTCLNAGDTARLQQALDAPLDSLSTDNAGLFVEFEQLEAFAGAQLESTFDGILTRCIHPILRDRFHTGIRVCSFYSHKVLGLCSYFSSGGVSASLLAFYRLVFKGSCQQETSESSSKKVWCAFAGLQRRPRLTAPTCSAGRIQSYRQPDSWLKSTLCPFRCANLLSPPSQDSVSLAWHTCQRQPVIETPMQNFCLVALLADLSKPHFMAHAQRRTCGLQERFWFCMAPANLHNRCRLQH